MTGRSIQNRWTIPNVVLTLAVIGGLILCYFLAIPFLPAIVWSVTLGVLFVPLDARLRRWTRSANISAAAMVAIVAFIVVVPGILVVGSLLNEATRSVAVISPMLDADRWTHLLDNHPRLAPTLRWINERLDLPDLIKASDGRLESAGLMTWPAKLSSSKRIDMRSSWAAYPAPNSAGRP